tara:strand:- start:233 stop:637 length:405 start_codon:yes stop_codon:yes gene_type:complete
MKQIIKENVVKNIILAAVLFLLYTPINRFISQSALVADKALSGDALVAVSVLAVIACFGNFAFTYEKINEKNTFQRYLAHITTGLLMFAIGASLIFSDILIAIIMGRFIITDIVVLSIYLASIGYDFWDVYRIN